MANNLETNLKKSSRELDAFYTALKSFFYYTELRKYGELNRSNDEFWDLVEFTLLYSMLVNWNEVFGMSKKNTHWNKLTLENSEYVNILYSAGNFDYTNWTEYRRYINEICHNFILFPDPYHHKDQEYNIQGMKISLEITHQWLNEKVSNNTDLVKNDELNKWPLSNKDYINDLKSETQTIVNSILHS